MYTIVICDDEPRQLRQICMAADNYFAGHPEYEVRILDFDNAVMLLEYLEKSGGCEVALLDICMPGINGVDIGNEIRKRKDHTEIIFLTNSNEFAAEAFELEAAHYLLKPYTQEQFDRAMDRVFARYARKNVKKLLLSLENGAIQSVDANGITYIESIRYNRVVHTQSGEYEEKQRSLTSFMEELERLLPGQFFVPYRGYIVNKEAIESVKPDGIVLQDGIVIPVKAGDFRKIREMFFEWTFRQEGFDW